jgi:hypothetical protein
MGRPVISINITVIVVILILVIYNFAPHELGFQSPLSGRHQLGLV